jgi:hypothetical protein
MLWNLTTDGPSKQFKIRDRDYVMMVSNQNMNITLERGNLYSTQKFIEHKISFMFYEFPENTAVGICHADNVIPPIRKSWHYLRWQAAVARSVQFDRGLRPRSFYTNFQYYVDTCARSTFIKLFEFSNCVMRYHSPLHTSSKHDSSGFWKENSRKSFTAGSIEL